MDVIVYANAYHGFDSLRPPVHAKNVVTGVGCNFNADVARFVVKVRATGEDITRSVANFSRTCAGKGATVGGDSEGRKKSPEDVKIVPQESLRPLNTPRIEP